MNTESMTEVTDLAGILKTFLKDRQHREAEVAKECRWHEEELEAE